VQRQKASTPNRPFFCYFSTPAVHAPHHVAQEWIDKFKGQFDEGWDALREHIYQRQLELGVIPGGTALTQRPEQIPAWDDYPKEYKPVARRLMETFAGFLAHTDAQIHRVLQAIEDLGEMDNTLVIYITGDNGASGEGTVHGAWSAPSFQNGRHEDPEWLLAHLDDFGTDRCENHFNVGWAWALDSPFQWMKQVASHFGGTRNAMAISWPRKIRDAGGLRTQFHHVVDIAPTIYEVVGITPPTHVNGIEQMEIHGTSMAYTFDDASSPSTRRSQYFEILGNRAIYHEGWMASCFHGRLPWIRLAGFEFDGPQEKWELYDVENDFSQAVDLAATYPDKLRELEALWWEEAAKYKVLPVDDGSGSRLRRPVRKKFVLWPGLERVPSDASPRLTNTSYTIAAHITVPVNGCEGVLISEGDRWGGYVMFVQDGKPCFHYHFPL
jgi:arylsulfatase